MRDARILTIYEGTNGIQAIDLVGRKLPLGNGEVVRAYIGEMRETAEMCRQSNHPVLTQVAGELGDAIDAFETATDWLLDRLKSSPKDTLAGATPYLRLFGLAAGGHYLAKGALAATQEEALDPAFVNRKLSSIRFFGSNMLTACGGLAASAMAGNDVVDDIGLEALAG